VRVEPVEVAVGHCALTIDALALTQEEVIFQVPTMLPPHAVALPHVPLEPPQPERNINANQLANETEGMIFIGTASCEAGTRAIPYSSHREPHHVQIALPGYHAVAIVLNPPNSRVFVSIAFWTRSTSAPERPPCSISPARESVVDESSACGSNPSLDCPSDPAWSDRSFARPRPGSPGVRLVNKSRVVPKTGRDRSQGGQRRPRRARENREQARSRRRWPHHARCVGVVPEIPAALDGVAVRSISGAPPSEKGHRKDRESKQRDDG
jgi:hypothetical protein